MFVRNAFKGNRLPITVLVIAISLSVAGMIAAQTGGAPAANELTVPPSPSPFPGGIPRLELFLNVALERHPDVIVARSKMEAARSEVLRAEATALKELMQLHQRVLSNRALLENSKKGTVKVPAETASDMSLLEWEFAMALGMQRPGQPTARSTPAGPSQPADSEADKAPEAYVDIAYPKGDIAAKVKAALATKLTVDLPENGLKDLCEVIAGEGRIQVVIDETGLSDGGFEIEATVFKIKSNDLPISALLQQVEDRYEPVYFVIRDYGILVTTEDSAPADAVSLRDFANLTEQEIRTKYRARLEALTRSGLGGGGGGMGGGGGFF